MTESGQLTVDTIAQAIEQAIKSAAQRKDVGRLAELQAIAGYLMRPAEAARDRETERRMRILAARAANAREDLEREQER